MFDKKCYKYLIYIIIQENKISGCGENEMKKAVATILPQILTNELGTKLVWMIKVEGKLAIQNYTFPSIIASMYIFC